MLTMAIKKNPKIPALSSKVCKEDGVIDGLSGFLINQYSKMNVTPATQLCEFGSSLGFLIGCPSVGPDEQAVCGHYPSPGADGGETSTHLQSTVFGSAMPE